jgi:hypothetical protein
VYKILILPALALFLTSCGSSNNNSPGYLKYDIIAGEGGGAAGIMEGIMIDSTGIIFSFRGRTFETSEKKEKGHLSVNQMIRVNEIISSVENIDQRESGNLYKFIILRDQNKQEKRLSWTYSTTKRATADSLEQFYGEITGLLYQLNKN